MKVVGHTEAGFNSDRRNVVFVVTTEDGETTAFLFSPAAALEAGRQLTSQAAEITHMDLKKQDN